jgi:carbonic anhydrase/acetyltransferase-like protein (isoleucine patch superfamily)
MNIGRHGAVILHGVRIGQPSIISAKSLLRHGIKIPLGWLLLGGPAKAVRKLKAAERAYLKRWAQQDEDNGACCLEY